MDFQAYNKILICKGNIRNTFVDGLKTDMSLILNIRPIAELF